MRQAKRHADSTRSEEDVREARMGFLDHLEELRTRLIRSAIAVVAGMVVALCFVDQIAEFVLRPTLRVLPPGTDLIFTKPGEGFSFYLDLALIGGIVLSAPFVTYQVWRFVAPGLRAREKRLVIPFMALATAGTVGGVLFSHYALFPGMMKFFGAFGPAHVKFMPRIEDTFDLYKDVMLGMVAVFQIPTLAYVLAKMRIVTARFLLRHFGYAAVISAILSAVLTPTTDPWNQIVFAAPMLLMYLIGIVVAWIVGLRQRGEATNGSPHLKLVFAATVLDQARRQRIRQAGPGPRAVR